MGKPVSWFEINSSGHDDLHAFYSKVFDWEIDGVGNGYGVVDTKSEKGIAGGIGPAQGPNQVTFYVEVPDLEKALKSVESNGGKTVVPVTEIPDLVTFAQFADPEGNVIGLFKGEA